MFVVVVGMRASITLTGLSMGVIPIRLTSAMRVLMPMVFLFMLVIMSVVSVSMMVM
jgi:hypothetical protein